VIDLIAFAALAVWIYLVSARGDFWLASARDPEAVPPAAWPTVIAVIPARDEAEGVTDAIGSLLRQDYAGSFSVVLVDDQSRDGTAELARHAAVQANAGDRLTVLTGAPRPPGWTGKLWAMQQGASQAETRNPDYILFADADIVFEPHALSRLVARAESQKLVLASRMVKLHCREWPERMLIPAFIYFFQMLYPFAWVNRREATTAAAAGGCMLVRGDALHASGGLEGIRDALIDDCALARQLKRQGPIELALTEGARSIRVYAGVDEIRHMISRSAYAQLRYSPLLLAGAIAGMAVIYLAPVLLAFFADDTLQTCGLLAWAIMAVSFIPTLRFYRLSAVWGLALPFVALAYMAFTLDSAWQHSQGRGGLWKGRAQADLGGER
jgi:hopene-associated glycosyltransferase HpnB